MLGNPSVRTPEHNEQPLARPHAPLPLPLVHTRSSSSLESTAPAPSILNPLPVRPMLELVPSLALLQAPCDIPPGKAQQPTCAQTISTPVLASPPLPTYDRSPTKEATSYSGSTQSHLLPITDEDIPPTAINITNSPIVPENIRLLDARPWKPSKKKSIWRQSVSILIIVAYVCIYAVTHTHLHHCLPCIILTCLHFIPSADTVSTIRGQIA